MLKNGAMVRWVLVVTLFFVSLVGLQKAAMGATKTRIIPFKVWKQKKIDEAKTIVAELKRELKKNTQVKAEDAEGDGKEETADKLSQAELSLGVSRELSANDYFLLYVAPQFKNNNEALIQAAKTLSSRDMADIMLAYQKRLDVDTTSSPEDGNSASSPEKTAKAP